MNFDKQLDVFSRNLSEIRRNGRYSYQAFSEKLRVRRLQYYAEYAHHNR